MRIKDMLPKEQQKKINTIQVPKKEKLSHRDIEELMGIRGPRYYRGRGGALRQK